MKTTKTELQEEKESALNQILQKIESAKDKDIFLTRDFLKILIHETNKLIESDF